MNYPIHVGKSFSQTAGTSFQITCGLNHRSPFPPAPERDTRLLIGCHRNSESLNATARKQITPVSVSQQALNDQLPKGVVTGPERKRRASGHWCCLSFQVGLQVERGKTLNSRGSGRHARSSLTSDANKCHRHSNPNQRERRGLGH